MTEHAFYRDTVRENLVDLQTVRARILEQPARARPSRTRTLLLAAACLILLLAGVVACIPQARETVLSWFGYSPSVRDYLGKAGEDRQPLPAVGSLIVPQAASSPVPAMPPHTGAGERLPRSEAAKRIAALLGEGLDVTLRETLYDGQTLYLSLSLGSGFGLWLLESSVGGDRTSVVIPPEKADGFFDGGAPEAYRSGAEPLYSFTEGYVQLTLPDGSRIDGAVGLTADEDLTALQLACMEQPANAAALADAYLAAHDVTAVADIPAQAETLDKFADADGMLTLPATLRLVIEEESSREGPTTVLLEAELGEVTFRCAGYSRHQTVVEGGSNAVTLSGRHCVTVEDSAHAFDKQDPYRTYTMYAIDMDGVRLQITDVERTATGITDMAVDIRFPESMSETDVDRFCKCIGLYFRIHVDGVADGWVQGGRHIQRTKDDARHAVYHTGQLYGIPLELLPELREIALTPVFASSKAYCFVETAADGAAREGQPIPFEEGVAVDLPTDPEGGFYFRPVEQTVFSDCAMTVALP